MALTRNKPRVYSNVTRQNSLALAAASSVFEGAAIGIDATTGRARAVVVGDVFAGFAAAASSSLRDVLGATPSEVRLVSAGEALLAVAGVLANSVGASVYATDDDTFSLTGSTLVGEVLRVPAAGLAVVAFFGGRNRLSSAQVAALQALAAWAGKSQAGQAGIVVVNNGQLLARSLVSGPGAEILYPTGVGGDPVIYTPPGRVLLGSLLGADLASTADQAIQIREYPQYMVKEIVVTNASATPVAAAGGVYSAPGKAGRVLVGSGQGYTGLTDESVVLQLTLGTLRRLTGPAVYLSLTTPNGSACTADVHVFGDWLMG